MRGKLELLVRALQKRGFIARACVDREEAAATVLEMAQEQQAKEPLQVIGAGNSDTLRATGILERLRPLATSLYVHQPTGSAVTDRKALTADIYLTSANAISLDGQIVNIDGTGNRTASTCFGPRLVIFLVGRNKIATTLEEALARARQAAVALCRRYGRNTPCVVTGKCEDCLSPECICAVTTIHRRKPFGVEMAVILIDEDLGI